MKKILYTVLFCLTLIGCSSKDVYLPGHVVDRLVYCEIPTCQEPAYINYNKTYNQNYYENNAKALVANNYLKNKYIECLKDSVNVCKIEEK